MKKNGGKRAWPAAGPFLPQSRLGEVAAAGLQAVPGGTPGIAVRLFRRLFEQTPDGVSINELLLDDRGAPCNYRVLEVNPAFERLTGLGRDEVLGRTAKELLFHRDDRWFADFSEVVRTGRQMRFEWRSRRLGKFFEASACALEDGRFAIFLKDITEQREAERALRESEAKYRLLVEQLPAVTYMHIFDGPSKGTYLSSQAEAMLGLDQGQGRPDFSANPGLWRDMVHPEDRARFLVELDQARETRRPLDCEYRFLTRDGRTPWLHDKAVFLRDETGNPVGIQGVLFDVSDRKLAESRLKDSLSFLQTLMDAVPHPVFYKDRERRFIGCNRAFGDYIGLPVEALIGRRACELFPGGQAEGYEKQDDEMLSEPGELIYEQRVRHGDGSLRHALLHKATFAGADGRVGGIVGTVTDITGLREAEKKLKYLALYDELTGLPNRRLFYDRLAQAMSRTRRGEGKMALLYVDLDEFKSINDCLGHDGGDAVLREVGRRMGACVREMDTVARLGGDEFALILQDVTTREDVEFVADRLVASLTRPIQCCTDTERAVGVSIGISLYPDDGEEPDGLLKKADLAMYRMKGEGKNGYRFFHLP